jgi:hypothetical protein
MGRGLHSSGAIEVVVVTIAIIVSLTMASISYFNKAGIIWCLLIPGAVGAATIILSTPFMGGLIYEVKNENLVIRSGLLRICIKIIPIKTIRQMEISNYNVFKSTACGWYNIFPDGSVGYVRGFKGEALLVYTIIAKYLLASENPEELKGKIGHYMKVDQK